jgi:hypothetical protein
MPPLPHYTATNQPAQGNLMPGIDTGEHLAWSYDNRLGIIAHDADTCGICDSWSEHLFRSACCNNALLRLAKDQRDDAICGDLHIEITDLCEDNADLCNELTTACTEIDKIRTALVKTEKELDDVKDDLDQVEDQYNDAERDACHAQATIDELRRCIYDLESDEMPHCCKMACLDSCESSTSRPRQPYARLSRTDSPVIADRDVPDYRSQSTPPVC